MIDAGHRVKLIVSITQEIGEILMNVVYSSVPSTLQPDDVDNLQQIQAPHTKSTKLRIFNYDHSKPGLLQMLTFMIPILQGLGRLSEHQSGIHC